MCETIANNANDDDDDDDDNCGHWVFIQVCEDSSCHSLHSPFKNKFINNIMRCFAGGWL